MLRSYRREERSNIQSTPSRPSPRPQTSRPAKLSSGFQQRPTTSRTSASQSPQNPNEIGRRDLFRSHKLYEFKRRKKEQSASVTTVEQSRFSDVRYGMATPEIQQHDRPDVSSPKLRSNHDEMAVNYVEAQQRSNATPMSTDLSPSGTVFWDSSTGDISDRAAEDERRADAEAARKREEEEAQKRAEAERQAKAREAARKRRDDARRAAQEREAAERRAAEKKDAEGELERRDAERREAEQKAAQRREAERKRAAEKAEADGELQRRDAERREAEQKAAQRREAERKRAAEKAEADKRAAETREAARKAAEEGEAARRRQEARDARRRAAAAEREKARQAAAEEAARGSFFMLSFFEPEHNLQ